MKNGKSVWGVLFGVTVLLSLLATFAPFTDGAKAGPLGSRYAENPLDNPNIYQGTVVRVSEVGDGVVKYINVQPGRSIAVELPRKIRDVMVSNPETIDAVVHTSNRVHVITKAEGMGEVFFYGHDGQVLFVLRMKIFSPSKGLAATIRQKERELEKLIKSIIPTSRVTVRIIKGAAYELAIEDSSIIKARISNNAGSNAVGAASLTSQTSSQEVVYSAVLLGHVNTPAEAARATRIAKYFMGAVSKRDDDERAGVLNLLTVAAKEQVMLKVTIAEVQREALKQFGVNMGGLINSGNVSFAPLVANSFPLTDGAFATSAAGQVSGLVSDYTSNSVQIDKTLQAMERTGLLRTLAEPNLTAVSGETANFLVGGEFPVPIPSLFGLSVKFKKFGVGLAFTPVVLSEGRISLKIDAEVSEISAENSITTDTITIPGIRARRAKTTVELPSGGSIAMAGLITDDTRQNIEGLPGLKELPILGTLFRSRDFRRKETELVIIVTPYVVRPVTRAKLARPDDGFAPASDAKANFLGQLNRVYGGKVREVEMPDTSYKGDYGFIVE